jgi:ADP-heptose:LPS heptosyltransferase
LSFAIEEEASMRFLPMANDKSQMTNCQCFLQGFKKMSLSDPQNILVIHIAGLGQTTLSLPALHSLRTHFHNSRLTVVTSAQAADLLRLTGYIDEILEVGRFKGSEFLSPLVIYRSAKTWNEMRHNAFDILIELSDNTETSMLAESVNAHRRLRGTNILGKGTEFFLRRILGNLTRRPPPLTHIAHEFLKRIEPLGVRPVDAEPKLQTDPIADEQFEKLLRKSGVGMGEIMIGIHPGAGSPRVKWPLERFTSIASRMINNFGARVLVFAGPNERGLAGKLAAQLPAKRTIEFQSPKLSEFVSAAARLSLLVANHSGPAHVTAAVGTPVVVISTSTNPSPKDLLGTHHEHIRGSHISLISEEAVYEATCRMLKRSRAEYLRGR